MEISTSFLNLSTSSAWSTKPATVLDPLALTITPPAIKALYSTIGCLGFMTNTLTMAIVAAYKPFRDFPLTTYILALGTADAMAAAFLLCTTIFDYDGSTFEYNSAWHNLLCKCWYRKGVLWAAMLASTFIIMAISVERYMAVVHPIFYKRKFSKKKIYAAALIALAVVLGPSSQIPVLIMFSSINRSGQCSVFSGWNTPEAKMFLGLYPIVVNYFVPLIFMTVVYLRIACALRTMPKVGDDEGTTVSIGETKQEGAFTLSGNAALQGSNHPAISEVRGSKGSRGSEKASRVVLKTSVWIAMCYIGCYTMNQLYYFFSFLGLANVNSEVFYHLRFVVVFLHCFLNPVVYCIKMAIFREGVKWFFRQAWRKLLTKV